MNDPLRARAPLTEDASVTTIRGLLDDVVELEREVARLRDALAVLTSVERATGMLMLAYGYGPDRAVTVLRAWATDLGASPQSVAQSMVEAVDTAVETDATPGRWSTAVPAQRLPGQ
ncbi:ANTAR domain-containing protein [Nocardioides aurantiacus]|uniref:ANTAR domain-containing protein n=1 Tax=Nocardioides aurantiacus TaxID=86796 RepID=A0A3N2CWF2_9ACTN|nr:ANTAR domain-containing protein [Nocardioides aurantiacus]ROR91882.1 ANTAR domain-containing protein [Nocardioides aurantiacus]